MKLKNLASSKPIIRGEPLSLVSITFLLESRESSTVRMDFLGLTSLVCACFLFESADTAVVEGPFLPGRVAYAGGTEPIFAFFSVLVKNVYLNFFPPLFYDELCFCTLILY